MGSERVMGSATKTNWKRRYSSQLGAPGPSRVIFRNLSVKVVARILRRILVTIYIYTRNVLLSAQMGERASVVLICIITSRYNEVK